MTFVRRSLRRVPPLRWLVLRGRLVRAYVGSFGIAGGTKIGIEIFATGKATLELAGERETVSVRRPGSDISVFNQVFVHREYDHPCLPPHARLVVDAGANVGYASLFFAARYPAATVVAIEPERRNFEALCRNVTHNRRIEPVHAALWPTQGRVGIANPEANAWAFQVTAQTAGDIEALGVPDLLARFASPTESIDVLKIDIEGAEKELFEAGIDGWIDRVGALVIETHDRLRPGCTDAVVNALSGWPYRRYERGENLFFVLG